MSFNVFLATVTDQFRAYRDQLRGDPRRHNVGMKVQDDCRGLGHDTLGKLDDALATLAEQTGDRARREGPSRPCAMRPRSAGSAMSAERVAEMEAALAKMGAAALGLVRSGVDR